MSAATAGPIPAAAVALAARAAARAVRVSADGLRVRMPVLGSVEHGTPAAALKGCPCLACDRLRDRLTATTGPHTTPEAVPTTAAQPATGASSGPAARPAEVSARQPLEVDQVAVDRACGGGLPAVRLTVAERTAAVSRLTRSGLSARQVSVRIGLTPRTVVRARQRAREHAGTPAPPAPVPVAGSPAGGADSWRDEALCRQVDPELFYPDAGGSTRQAKRVCAGCPVRAECLAWAVEHGERYGVWGGLSPAERVQLRHGMEEAG